MKVSKNKVVTFHYSLKNNKGETIDSSEKMGPISFIHGSGEMISGLEKELENRAAGEKFSAEISPDEGYGFREEGKVQEVPLTSFRDPENLKVGIHINLQTEDGPQMAQVVGIGDTNVTIDMNHPLADETLFFDIELTDVREPTQEELAHGHVHGPGGHHH